MSPIREVPARPRLRGALACCAIVALLLCAPRMAVAAISAGATIDMPWMQSLFADVTAAVLADGSFAVASPETFQLTSQDFTIRLEAQFFRATGAPQTLPLVLQRGPFPYAGIGSVGSRYFVTWQDAKRGHAGFYGPTGSALGQPFPWPRSDIDAYAGRYRYGNAPRWRFLPITYERVGLDDAGNPDYRIFLQVAQPTGQLLGAPVELAPDRVADVEDAAIDGGGRFVVVSSQCDPCLCVPCERAMQIFDGAAMPLTPLLTAGVPQYLNAAGTATVNSVGSAVAMDAQGRVLLVWVTDLDQPLQRLAARLYDPQGEPLSEVFQIGPAAAGLRLLPMKALDDGSFVASWLVFSGAGAQLFAARLNPAAGTFEAPVALAQGPISGALVELNGAGRGVAVWQTQVFAEGQLISNEGHLKAIRVKP